MRRRRPHSTLIVSGISTALLANACNFGKSSFGDRDTGDSGQNTDDTDDTADMLTFAIEGDAVGMTLSLTRLHLDDDDLSVGSFVSSTNVKGATVAIAGPTVSDSELDTLDPDLDFGIALFIPSLHEDDGDGILSEGETIVGAGIHLPMFISGTVPSDMQAFGFEEGWSSILITSTSEESLPEIGGVDAIPLPTNLIPNDAISMAGTADETGTKTRLALIPNPMLEGESVNKLLWDESLENTWAIELNGPPDDDHYTIVDDETGTAYAFEIPIGYKDMDNSYDLSDGDIPYAGACIGDIIIGLIYAPAPTDIETAFWAAVQGLQTGWMGSTMSDDEEPDLLEEFEMQDLELSSDCF